MGGGGAGNLAGATVGGYGDGGAGKILTLSCYCPNTQNMGTGLTLTLDIVVCRAERIS